MGVMKTIFFKLIELIRYLERDMLIVWEQGQGPGKQIKIFKRINMQDVETIANKFQAFT